MASGCWTLNSMQAVRNCSGSLSVSWADWALGLLLLAFSSSGASQMITRFPALISLGRNELGHMIEEQGETDLTCQFCDVVYHFSKEELKTILQEATKA